MTLERARYKIIILSSSSGEQLHILILSVWCTAVDSRGHYFITRRKGVGGRPRPDNCISSSPASERTQCYQSRSLSATCCKNKKLLADYFAVNTNGICIAHGGSKAGGVCLSPSSANSPFSVLLAG